MSIYSNVDPGTKVYRSKFNLTHRKIFDCGFGEAIPALAKFVLPGDVWKISNNVLVRYQPTLAPILTRANVRMRYFFVPLRLVESNTDEVITGSIDGHLKQGYNGPFHSFLDGAPSNRLEVIKYSYWDYMGIPCGDYKNIRTADCMPAQYWSKAYYRIFWDYYRDENFTTPSTYESFIDTMIEEGGTAKPFSVNRTKDYFTSCLPWQLKGVTPTINFGSINYNNVDFATRTGTGPTLSANLANGVPFIVGGEAGEDVSFVDNLKNALNSGTLTGSINMDDLRTLSAQTRIFERLARCGSRYTEYLQSNFQIAPADGTLQRAQYLGGWKQPVITTEIAQTGTDGSNPVGTLRGHGISAGGNSIPTFVAREFGVLYGLLDVTPVSQYTQGINRELTYKSRFDFFNPSFQHLSEQEVRNGEVFINFTETSTTQVKNDSTFGFQAYANELRSSHDIIVGDMRDGLSYWTQALHFNSRPNLNDKFIKAINFQSSYNSPFAVTNAKPIIVDCSNILNVYRPMVRYSTPGLVDHL